MNVMGRVGGGLMRLGARMSKKSMGMYSELPWYNLPMRTYFTQATEGLMANTTVYASVRLIANACGGIPLLLYQKTRDKGGKRRTVEVEDHPLLSLIQHPNPAQSQAQFVKESLFYYRMSGKCPIYAPLPFDGHPRELYNLNPQCVQPVRQNGVIVAYDYNSTTGKTTIPTSEILMLKEFTPLNNDVPLSPLEPAAADIAMSNNAKVWNSSILRNGGRPSAVFKTDKVLNNDARNSLRRQLIDKFSSPRNAGKPLFLENGLDYQPVSFNAEDLDWLAGLSHAERQIAVAQGVPPELIGDATNKTFSNYGEGRKAFYEETVLPLMDYYTAELTNFLVPSYDQAMSMFFAYDKDDIEALQEDRNALWARVMDALTRGAITINEAREAIQYSPVDNGDVLLLPATMIPEPINGTPVAPTPPAAPETKPNSGGQETSPTEPSPAPGQGGQKRRKKAGAVSAEAYGMMTELAKQFERGEI